MSDKYHARRSMLIVASFLGIMTSVIHSAELPPAEQTLQFIENCMIHSPAPWPDEWKKEYLETIRSAIELHRDVPHYATRLEILRNGFEFYWRSFKKNKERSLFQAHQAQIRWYIDHLMSAEFPSEDERKKLRNQYKDLWNHAADSLLRQFPFLDPNAVQGAKQDDLSEFYRKIDAPLSPIYLRPFSDAQVERIKQLWDKLRYKRVDLWRRLVGGSTTPSENGDTSLLNAERDYQLTKESLSQLLGQIWMVVPQRPDYYRSALENRNKALQRRFQSKRNARRDQQRLERERSRQLLQTEHIGFLLSALLETPQCLEGVPSVVTQEQNPLEQQNKTAKGGDAYEVGTVSTGK